MQCRQELEVGPGVHPVHLLPYRGFHINFRVHLARRRGIGLTVWLSGTSLHWSCKACTAL